MYQTGTIEEAVSLADHLLYHAKRKTGAAEMLPDRMGQAHYGRRSLPAAQPSDRSNDRKFISGHAHL